ncbi:hypothetical protein [Saccharomonospora piscinae]|uniref:hypothetical protein n=1 Tax=Saccharomonospora piscinae TaxID=687388 RepID=UPI000462E9A4|nr:hypothetical protein [Saccharomonospora piscinae]
MATVEDSARSPSNDCRLCAGSGVLSWQQPQWGVLRTIEMPCPAGCGEHWTHPAQEGDRVVQEPDDAPACPEGNVAAANRIGADFIRSALEHWGYYPNGDHPKGS